MYQRRAKMLQRGTSYDFFLGYKKREQDVVEILRDLIVGKYAFAIYSTNTLLY